MGTSVQLAALQEPGGGEESRSSVQGGVEKRKTEI
jgi:hypothetical protein